MSIKHIIGSGLVSSALWVVMVLGVVAERGDQTSAGFALIATPMIFVYGFVIALCVGVYQKFISHKPSIRALYIAPLTLGVIFLLLSWI